MKKLHLLLALNLLFCAAIFSQTTKPAGPKGGFVTAHPAWIMQGNVYEVNVRQYTPEGTFNAFAKHLDRLKAMGVQTLWFMPINPISKKDRKGTMGSYYAVSDYQAVNPEFGTLADWKQLVKTIHQKGMKVIIDWVPNHTGADHRWLTAHPDFFVKDSSGQAAVPFDWTDTRQLDYTNRIMQDSMIAAMRYWLVQTGIDGFRCDVAWNVPGDFWKRCITRLQKIKPGLFMLAEGDKPYLHRSGFDATYPWDMFHMMVKVAAGERPAFALDSIRMQSDTAYPKSALELYFTSNHDENSWNKSDYATFPGASHAPFAVFTQTMVRSVPLIYSGQEEPVLRKIEFFEKDPMHFEKFQRADFYKTLLQLRRSNPALATNAVFRKVKAGDERAVYAYVREKAGQRVLVVLNFSASEQRITIADKALWGKTTNVFAGKPEQITGQPWTLAPWGYAVYAYAAARKQAAQ